MKKYEQITLVVLSYVIGFVTAFIAFELADQSVRSHEVPRTTSYENYGLVETDATKSAAIAPSQEARITDVVITNEGLFAKMGEEERIVSASRARLAERIPGYHTQVAAAVVSPDGRRLSFCAEFEDGTSECSCYVYDVESDGIYPVHTEANGTALTQPSDELSIDWLSDNRLRINDWESTSSGQPWVVE